MLQAFIRMTPAERTRSRADRCTIFRHDRSYAVEGDDAATRFELSEWRLRSDLAGAFC
jgi:hypothetical protein